MRRVEDSYFVYCMSIYNAQTVAFDEWNCVCDFNKGYLYDEDGNRAAKLSKDNKGTIIICRYFEAVYLGNTIVPPTQGTQGFDRYAYVNNNPVNGTDPTGMWMCGDWYDEGCIENYSERSDYARMFTMASGRPYEYYVTGSYDFELGKVEEVDRYQDDFSSMSPSFVPRGMAWWMSLLDLGVRLFDEYKPQPPYVAKDDFFWRVHVRDNPDNLELLSMEFWSPVETIRVHSIEYIFPETKRTETFLVSQFVTPLTPVSINVNSAFETVYVNLIINVTCYGCMTGSYYHDRWTPSSADSPKFTIYNLR